jgi:hypothetical protein
MLEPAQAASAKAKTTLNKSLSIIRIFTAPPQLF